MTLSGLTLVRAHFESFVAGDVDDFDSQLTPAFRYEYLPPILGAGPAQARRWRDILFRIYKVWRFEIVDAAERGDDVLLRVDWSGSDPVEPEHSPAIFEDTAVFVFTLEQGRLSSCNACYLDFNDHAEFERFQAEAR